MALQGWMVRVWGGKAFLLGGLKSQGQDVCGLGLTPAEPFPTPYTTWGTPLPPLRQQTHKGAKREAEFWLRMEQAEPRPRVGSAHTTLDGDIQVWWPLVTYFPQLWACFLRGL